MEQTLGIIIFIAIWIVQVFTGIIVEWRSRNLYRRFALKISDTSTLIDLLEKYMRIYEPLNVRVGARIWQPSLFKGELLFINDRFAHRSNLYILLHTILQAAMAREENKFLRNIHVWQVVAYTLQVALFVLAIVNDPLWLIPAIIVGVVLIVSSVFFYIVYGEMLIEVLDMAYILIDLSEHERKLSLALVNLWKEEMFKYGFVPARMLFRFIVPKRLG